MTLKDRDKARPTIVFDLDGTLVDSARDLIPTLNKVIESDGLLPVSRDQIGHLVGHGALKMLDHAYLLQKKALEKEVRGALHKKFLEIYAENLANKTIVFDGVHDLLEALKQKNWTLAVCTNKYEGLSKTLLSKLDLDHYFSAICGSDTFPIRKPDPAHLIKTIEQAGGDEKRAIMIGDSITDIKTAKAANIPVIAVTFGYSDVPVKTLFPTGIVSHYDEIKPLLEGWASTFEQ